MNRREWFRLVVLAPLVARAVAWIARLFPEPPYEEWPLGFTDVLTSDSVHEIAPYEAHRFSVAGFDLDDPVGLFRDGKPVAFGTVVATDPVTVQWDRA